MKIAVVVLALIAVAAAVDTFDEPVNQEKAFTEPTYKEQGYHAPAHYKFDWAVKDDYYNDFGQYEAREVEKTTGSYWVVLPDGRKQIVTYYVDGNSGYVADVKYEGEAQAYDYKPAYKSTDQPEFE